MRKALRWVLVAAVAAGALAALAARPTVDPDRFEALCGVVQGLEREVTELRAEVEELRAWVAALAGVLQGLEREIGGEP